MDVETIAANIAGTTRRLEALAAKDQALLARSYALGKWTGLQILAHLADTEMIYLYRFLGAVAENTKQIVPFDQDRWVAELAADRRPAALSMQMIGAARAVMVHHLRTLPRASLERKVMHPERGELSPLRLADGLASHAAHHLEQLDAIVAGQEWTPSRQGA